MEARMAVCSGPLVNTRSRPLTMSEAQQAKGMGSCSILTLPIICPMTASSFSPLATWSSPIDMSIMLMIFLRFSPSAMTLNSPSFPFAKAPPTSAPIDVPATDVML